MVILYERERVESLIPGVWDDWRILEARDETKPDDDMPKAPKGDPRAACNKWAELADIQRAWREAVLTERQRQAVLLRHGLDMTETEAAEALSVARSTLREHAFCGVTVLMNFLNGVDCESD